MADSISRVDRRNRRSRSSSVDSEAARKRQRQRTEQNDRGGRAGGEGGSGPNRKRDTDDMRAGGSARRDHWRGSDYRGGEERRGGARDNDRGGRDAKGYHNRNEEGRESSHRASEANDAPSDGARESLGRRHRYDEERDQKRRRSRSPHSDHDRRRHRDRSLRHRSRKSQSPQSSGGKEPDTRPRKEDAKFSVKKSGPLPSQEASFSKGKGPSTALVPASDKPLEEKQKPNFAPTGLLAAETNTVAKADGTSIVLKYHEPPEARKPPPRDKWKLFVFKGSDIVDTIELSLRSCWLIGRELSVVDLAAEHPSISKQHAVIQFRYIEKRSEFGDKSGKVKPYLIDLESANGTSLNKEPIPGSRYLELRDKDMIQFGDSTREYVLMLPPKE